MLPVEAEIFLVAGMQAEIRFFQMLCSRTKKYTITK
jgi:hypothetical protein